MQFVNRAKHVVFLPLTTGSVHLAPGETSRRLEPYETDSNPRLDRLVERGVIVRVARPDQGGPKGHKSEPPSPS